MCSVFTYCVHAVLEKVNTDRSRWWVLPPVRQPRRQSCKITHAPLRARIGPMGALAALSPGSTLPRPRQRQEPANLRIEPTISHPVRKPKFGDKFRRLLPGRCHGRLRPQAWALELFRRSNPRSTSASAGSCRFPSIGSTRPRPRNTSVSAFRKDPLALASCLSWNCDFSAKRW